MIIFTYNIISFQFSHSRVVSPIINFNQIYSVYIDKIFSLLKPIIYINLLYGLFPFLKKLFSVQVKHCLLIFESYIGMLDLIITSYKLTINVSSYLYAQYPVDYNTIKNKKFKFSASVLFIKLLDIFFQNKLHLIRYI